MTLKTAMRLESNDIFCDFIVLISAGSVIILAFTLSRCARDLKTIQESN